MDKATDRGSKDNENSEELDLTGLQNFNFASNWGESAPTISRDSDSRRQGGQRRERGSDRRPAGAREGKPRSDERRDRRPNRSDRRRPDRQSQRDERTPQMVLRDSPFDIQIYPEETKLATLTQAMRHSLRTYELFEISRLVLEKPDRFQVNLRWSAAAEGGRSLYLSVPDGIPFLSEEAAVDHVFRAHLETFFTVEEIEVEPPKGSFQFVGKCTLTGDVLGPPNYHRYQAILLQYHQERFPDMPFEQFRSKIETVKDDEAIAKWLESMKTQTRYRLIGGSGDEEKTFDSPEEARAHLLRSLKDKVVRSVKAVTFSGTQLDAVPNPDIQPYVKAYVEHQRRFPLDTANALRGRLRRQHFFIYKKGSRGISFVCAVKRKFRQPGQIFSDTVQALIRFLEDNDQIHASQLPEKFLGLEAAGEGEEAPALDPGQQEKLTRLSLDLRWLLSEGYVTEYSDGRLSVHAVAPAATQAAPARKPEEKSKAETAPEGETAAEAEAAANDAAAPASEEPVAKSAEETPAVGETPASQETGDEKSDG